MNLTPEFIPKKNIQLRQFKHFKKLINNAFEENIVFENLNNHLDKSRWNNYMVEYPFLKKSNEIFSTKQDIIYKITHFAKEANNYFVKLYSDEGKRSINKKRRFEKEITSFISHFLKINEKLEITSTEDEFDLVINSLIQNKILASDGKFIYNKNTNNSKHFTILTTKLISSKSIIFKSYNYKINYGFFCTFFNQKNDYDNATKLRKIILEGDENLKPKYQKYLESLDFLNSILK